MMKRPPELLRDAVTAARERRKAVTSQSERNIMLSTILIASAISAATGYILTQCYSVDVLASLLYPAEDCWLDWPRIGRHCFSDYSMIADGAIQPNPSDFTIALPPSYQPIAVGTWAPQRIPIALFALPAHWLGAPRLGLIGYLVALTISVLSPAIWASRGAQGLERIVVLVALGAMAIPAWATIDRGNSAGFMVPIALVFFVALRRQRWGLVAVMVILATMVKPQFVLLGVVFLAARQWRMGWLTLAGIAISNIGAFLLWPTGFPGSITRSIHDIMKYNNSFGGLHDTRNVAFARGLLLIPDGIKNSQTGQIPDDFLLGPRTTIGFLLVIVVVFSVLALGRRIPPVMAGIVLLATGCLFPAYVSMYYLAFALPVAALVVRDPDGPPGVGLFSHFEAEGDRRRAVGVCVSLAAAFSIAQVATPSTVVHLPIYGQLGAHGEIGSTAVVPTTVSYPALFWLVACAVILVSYARKPGQDRPRDSADDTGSTAPEASTAPEPMAESSSKGTATAT